MKKINKLVGSLALLFCFGFTLAPNPTPTPAPEACYMQNQTFQGGEELTYKLYYNWNFVWMAAGEVTFKVEDTGTQYHLSAVGKTYGSYDRFFKVRDNYDTYLDKNSLLPVVSIRDVKEGNYVLYDKVVLNQSEHKAISYRGDNATQTTKRDFELSGCMHDILSVLYYARNVDYNQYKTGMTFPIKLFMDKQEHPLSFKYKGKAANVALRDMGKYNAIKFSPQIINGRVFKEGSEVNVYVSDDANKIPLLIESPLSVGSVKAVLKSYKGLRYDFNAKVE
ncbi:MAG: hypothetical protein RLZZ292_1098 [Bacteroidota bacterium]|jgi:hypothetical protein